MIRAACSATSASSAAGDRPCEFGLAVDTHATFPARPAILPAPPAALTARSLNVRLLRYKTAMIDNELIHNVRELRDRGLSPKEIARSLGMRPPRSRISSANSPPSATPRTPTSTRSTACSTPDGAPASRSTDIPNRRTKGPTAEPMVSSPRSSPASDATDAAPPCASTCSTSTASE